MGGAPTLPPTCERRRSPPSLLSSTPSAELKTDDHHGQSEGKVTIPEPLPDHYRFPLGTTVIWPERDGDLIPESLLSVEQLRGRVKGDELMAFLLAARAQDRKHEHG